jgi:hypothetical protein
MRVKNIEKISVLNYWGEEAKRWEKVERVNKRSLFMLDLGLILKKQSRLCRAASTKSNSSHLSEFLAG